MKNKPITPKEWNKLTEKEKMRRCNQFMEHAKEWDKFGVPYGLIDLELLAVKYQTPLPTLRKNQTFFFKGFK